MTEQEIYHYGVKGMRWGVRKDRRGSTSSDAKRVCKKGSKYAKKHMTKTAKGIISSTTAVASGALWVASTLVRGGPSLILNAGAAALNAVSIVTSEGNN